MAYGKSNRAAVQAAKVGGGSEFWTPPDGTSRVRVMPPWSEDVEDFWFTTGTHYNVGPDGKVVACPALSNVREGCFLCRIARRLAKGDEDEAQESDEISARPRVMLTIVDMDDIEAGPQVWACPITIFRKIRKLFLNEDEWGDMISFEDGYCLDVEKTGSLKQTRYELIPARKNTVFPSDKMLNHRDEAVADMYQQIADEEFELPILDEVQKFLDDSEMERVYKGLSDGSTREEPKDEEDDDRPRGKPRRAAAAEEEDADGGDTTEEEPAEEEEPTPKKARSRRAAAEEEPAEEEPTPTKRRARSRRAAAEEEPAEEEPKPKKSRRRPAGKTEDLE